jgi:hypothetical protein
VAAKPFSLFGLSCKVARRHHLAKRKGSGSIPAASINADQREWSIAAAALTATGSYLGASSPMISPSPQLTGVYQMGDV